MVSSFAVKLGLLVDTSLILSLPADFVTVSVLVDGVPGPCLSVNFTAPELSTLGLNRIELLVMMCTCSVVSGDFLLLVWMIRLPYVDMMGRLAFLVTLTTYSPFLAPGANEYLILSS